MSTKKALKNNPLTEDDVIMKDYYRPTSTKSASDKKPRNTVKKNSIKPEKKISINEEIKISERKGKLRSFDGPVEKISLDLPQELVMKLRMEAVQKKTRINKIMAEALDSYLK